jgi:hypothetical protein
MSFLTHSLPTDVLQPEVDFCILSDNEQNPIDDGFVKSPPIPHPGERRGPEPIENTGFRLSPESRSFLDPPG